MLQASERHHWRAEPGELGGGDVALLLPECVDYAHDGGSLTGEVAQAEQLHSGKTGSAQGGLELLLVAKRLELARGLKEVLTLMAKASVLQEIGEDVEVLRLHEPGVLLALGQVGVGAPLAGFVRDDRPRAAGHQLGVVRIGLGGAAVDPRVQALAPLLDASVRDAVEVALGDRGPARTAGVEVARIAALHRQDPFGKELRVASARLVAVGHEHERGVVAVGLEDPPGLFVDEGVNRSVLANRCALVCPDRALNLQVDPAFIGGNERGFGRAPGVEAHMVEAKRLARSEHIAPTLNVCWWVTCQREHARFEGSAQECGGVVDRDLGADRADLAQAEGGLP